MKVKKAIQKSHESQEIQLLKSYESQSQSELVQISFKLGRRVCVSKHNLSSMSFHALRDLATAGC